ncbi:DUF4349 domain-containing protein, partial [Agromyces tardus]
MSRILARRSEGTATLAGAVVAPAPADAPTGAQAAGAVGAEGQPVAAVPPTDAA